MLFALHHILSKASDSALVPAGSVHPIVPDGSECVDKKEQVISNPFPISASHWRYRTTSLMKRTLLLHLSALIFPFGLLADTGPYLGNALKIGEVTQDSAIIWTRLTQTRFFNTQGRSWIEYHVDIRPKKSQTVLRNWNTTAECRREPHWPTWNSA